MGGCRQNCQLTSYTTQNSDAQHHHNTKFSPQQTAAMNEFTCTDRKVLIRPFNVDSIYQFTSVALDPGHRTVLTKTRFDNAHNIPHLVTPHFTLAPRTLRNLLVRLSKERESFLDKVPKLTSFHVDALPALPLQRTTHPQQTQQVSTIGAIGVNATVRVVFGLTEDGHL
jgi:hypothetical protein